MNAATIYHLHAVFAHSNSNEAIEDKIQAFFYYRQKRGRCCWGGIERHCSWSLFWISGGFGATYCLGSWHYFLSKNAIWSSLLSPSWIQCPCFWSAYFGVAFYKDFWQNMKICLSDVLVDIQTTPFEDGPVQHSDSESAKLILLLCDMAKSEYGSKGDDEGWWLWWHRGGQKADDLEYDGQKDYDDESENTDLLLIFFDGDNSLIKSKYDD